MSFPSVYHTINAAIRTFHNPSGPIWPFRYIVPYVVAAGTGNITVPLRNLNIRVATD
jgi:hypothetical protein